MLNSICLLVAFVFTTNLYSQEICNNAIDDDGNGMIDLNDTACVCHGVTSGGSTVVSLIPNASFEQYSSCPTGSSQMNVCNGWVQATNATSDYMNTCGYTFGALSSHPSLQPFPDGNGIVGAVFLQDYKEYVGSCLTQPMIAGQSYTIQFSIASFPVDGSGDDCNSGIITYSTVDVSLFGSDLCSNMPVNTTDCPTAPTWYVLGTATYNPVSTWGLITITFTPTVTTNVIILGPPCILPSSYPTNGGACIPYFIFDNLIINTTASFNSLNVSASGIQCHNDVVVDAHIDTSGGSWQWYQNGIALAGQTDSSLLVSANNLPNGIYTAVYNLGNQCELDDVNINSTVPAVTIPTVTNVTCFGSATGNATANVIGANGNINYTWNSNPVQNGATATNLPAGIYLVTITDSLGCTASDTVTINSQAPIVTANNTQQICGSGSYTIGTSVYVNAGNYIDTLHTAAGCDSVVFTQLSAFPDHSINNLQTVCDGAGYTIGGHTYNVQGTYYDTLNTIYGCDSVIITQITNAQSQTINNNFTICAGDSVIVGNNTYSSTGIYIDSLLSFTSCDSILITNLYVMQLSSVNQQAICEGFSYTMNSHSYTSSGIYNDTLQTVFGCDSIVQTILTVNPLPQLIASLAEICEDTPFLPLNLVNPEGGVYSGNSVLNNIFYPTQTGLHSVEYKYNDPVTNCLNTILASIEVWPLPEVEFTLSPKVTSIDDPLITFRDETIGAKSWKWDLGDGTNFGDLFGTHAYADTGLYKITLEVDDIHGCKSVSAEQVFIGQRFSFYVPNAFTPNGDGINDEFNGKGVSIVNYHLSIFDRWGTEVFNTNSISENWDGKNSMSDTYVYKINLEDITGKSYEYVGSVTLIK